MRVYNRQEGEILAEGVNYNHSNHYQYVAIRHDDNVMQISWHKDSPKNYNLETYHIVYGTPYPRTEATLLEAWT